MALAQQHPEVAAIRARARNTSLPPHELFVASSELRGVCDEVQRVILRTARIIQYDSYTSEISTVL